MKMKMQTAQQSNLDRIREYGHQVRRDPESLAFVLLADAFREEGMLTEAAEVCRKGLEQHPSYGTARVVMGQIHEELGEMESAEQEYETALSLDPQNIMARMSLGKVLLRQDRRAAAGVHFEHVLFLNPTHEEASSLLEVADGCRPLPWEEHAADAAGQARPPEVSAEATEEYSGGDSLPSVEEIESTLRSLSELPGVLAVVLVEGDGLPIACHRNTSLDEEAFSALVSEINSAMVTCAQRMGMGEFERSVIEGAGGRMVLRRADPRVLVVATEPGTRLGMVNMIIDRAAGRLGNASRSTG